MKCKCIELSDISEYEDNDSCKAKYTIMQLQQENKQLKEIIDTIKKYIEESTVCMKEGNLIIYCNCDELLEKLKGDKNE